MYIITILAKTASCLNPLVYAISHPKYREAMGKELPCLGIGAAGFKSSYIILNTYNLIMVAPAR